MTSYHLFFQASELISFVVHHLLDTENTSSQSLALSSSRDYRDFESNVAKRHVSYTHYSHQLWFPCSNLCPVCQSVYTVHVSHGKHHYHDEITVQARKKQSLKVFTRLAMVCKSLYVMMMPILWQHLDLTTASSVYEQGRLRRWLQSFLLQRSQNYLVYPSSQDWLTGAMTTMTLRSHSVETGIIRQFRAGAFVKVIQITRSIWCSLDKRTLEAMQSVFPCVSTLQILDEVELGGVDLQEIHDIPGDPLNASGVGTIGDQGSNNHEALQWPTIHQTMEVASLAPIQRLSLLFPRLESLVLPECGLVFSASEVEQNEKRDRADINDNNMRRMKRTLSEPQVISSIYPVLLQDNSFTRTSLGGCSIHFMNLAHISCSFEPVGLLSLDLILNQLSVSTLTSVEIRARPSLLNQIHSLSLFNSIDGDEEVAFCTGLNTPLMQSLSLMRRVLCHSCTRDLCQIDIPDIEESMVHEIVERHSKTLKRLTLWRDGLSRDVPTS